MPISFLTHKLGPLSDSGATLARARKQQLINAAHGGTPYLAGRGREGAALNLGEYLPGGEHCDGLERIVRECGMERKVTARMLQVCG
jgi:hypothetical protein